MKRNMKILLTGACGKIAYSLYSVLLSGNIFGQDVEFDLNLLDLSSKQQQLNVLKEELQDCCFSHVKEISVYNETHGDLPFKQIDLAIFLGGMPRKPGMDRNELFKISAEIFQQQGRYLNSAAKKTCKSLVIANPACTNCMILASNAPTIPKSNFTALTRLGFNRFIVQISRLFECRINEVANLILWGNHSRKQFCDVNNLHVRGQSAGQIATKKKQLNLTEIQTKMYQKGGFILEKSAGNAHISATKAIFDHLKDLYKGSGDIISMGVIITNGEYGLPNGLCYSLPTRCLGNGVFEIIKDIQLNEFQKKRIEDNRLQLVKEQKLVESFLLKDE